MTRDAPPDWLSHLNKSVHCQWWTAGGSSYQCKYVLTLAKALEPIPAFDISFMHSVACPMAISSGGCFGKPCDSATGKVWHIYWMQCHQLHSWYSSTSQVRPAHHAREVSQTSGWAVLWNNTPSTPNKWLSPQLVGNNRELCIRYKPNGCFAL